MVLSRWSAAAGGRFRASEGPLQWLDGRDAELTSQIRQVLIKKDKTAIIELEKRPPIDGLFPRSMVISSLNRNNRRFSRTGGYFLFTSIMRSRRSRSFSVSASIGNTSTSGWPIDRAYAWPQSTFLRGCTLQIIRLPYLVA